MMTLWFLTAPLRCAFYYRWRGMHHSWNDTINRLMYAGFMGAECAMVAPSWHVPLWIIPFCIVGAFAGACIGHSSAQRDSADAYVDMAGILLLMNILLILPFWAYLCSHAGTRYPLIWTMPTIFSWFTIFSCWLGYRMKSHLYTTLGNFRIDWCVPGDSSWEEFYIGMFPIGMLIAFLGLTGY